MVDILVKRCYNSGKVKDKEQMMNERIANLYDQALVIENGGDYIAGELDVEKFAELIVRECIDYCGENLSKTVSGALKIHFGVEE